jgi:hypothetical protein
MSNQTGSKIMMAVAGLIAISAIVAVAYIATYGGAISEINIVERFDDRISSRLAEAGITIQSDGDNLIYVTGRGSIQTTPDRVLVHLGVETSNTSAVFAQRENSMRMSSVVNALISIDVSEADIKTTGLNLYPIRQNLREENGIKIIGYTARNEIIINVQDISKAGEVVDQSISSGANIISSISFNISEEKAESLSSEALKDAVKDAKKQATIAAEAADTKILGLKSLSLGRISVPTRVMKESFDVSSGSTPIMSGQTTITVTVSATFVIE